MSQLDDGVGVLPGSEPLLLIAERGWFAFYKPAGMNVHPAAESDEQDLAAWVAGQPDLPDDLMLVNRLDRDTSGIVLFAQGQEKCAEAHRWFADEEVKKSYKALVYGKARRKGIIRKPLQDQRRKRSLPAVTRYRCVEALGPLSLLVVRPESGRKHQIRRHLHSLGHSVVGDRRYRSKRRRSVPGFPGRLWLHSGFLELPDGFQVICPLPMELEEHLDLLRDRYSNPVSENDESLADKN